MAIYKRADSKFWWMKFTFDGELVQQSTKCTSKNKARDYESAFRTQLMMGKIGIKPKATVPTFENAATDFLEWIGVELGDSPGAMRYRFAVDVLKDFFGKERCDKINSKSVEKFIARRRSQESRKTGESITNDTINREVLVLKKIFNRLIDAEILTVNPVRSIKRLAANEPTFHVLTEHEEKIYLMACPQPLQDVAALMLETGMRCGEVYRIRRDEVFLDKGYLQVTKGKTKSSIRRVHLSVKAVKILAGRTERFAGAYLFPKGDRDGGATTNSLDPLHAEVMDRLKLDFRLYDCRHTFATRAIENDTDLVTLAAILGHSSLRMLTRYAHPSEKRKADAIRRLQDRSKIVQKQSKRK